ncbi:hypothetical protein ADK76_16885 [Streptomyces griseoflavus]|uniref:hypothetical protein n=1 Tax=Streptomyces rimosus TaxID=1927 RepID=UPI0004C830AD|nr:hypothetical protein [Streptomyces rimosus]KOG58704.1 hypothetical protein ADK76_16885 [Streptomyces griseoflavus]
MALSGRGTALAVTPNLPNRWRDGHEADRQLRPVNWSDKARSSSAAGMAQVRHQMRRIARGNRPTPGTHLAYALITEQFQQRRGLAPLPSRAAPGCLRHEAPSSRTAPRKGARVSAAPNRTIPEVIGAYQRFHGGTRPITDNRCGARPVPAL